MYIVDIVLSSEKSTWVFCRCRIWAKWTLYSLLNKAYKEYVCGMMTYEYSTKFMRAIVMEALTECLLSKLKALCISKCKPCFNKQENLYWSFFTSLSWFMEYHEKAEKCDTKVLNPQHQNKGWLDINIPKCFKYYLQYL